eukprot:g550.t1
MADRKIEVVLDKPEVAPEPKANAKVPQIFVLEDDYSPVKNKIYWFVELPLTLSLFVTCAVSFAIMLAGFPTWVSGVKTTMISLEEKYVSLLAKDKADFTSVFLNRVKSDVVYWQKFATEFYSYGDSTPDLYPLMVYPSLPEQENYTASLAGASLQWKQCSYLPIRDYARDWPTSSYDTELGRLSMMQIPFMTLPKAYPMVYMGNEDSPNPDFFQYPFRDMTGFKTWSGFCDARSTSFKAGTSVQGCPSSSTCVGNACSPSGCGYDHRCRGWYNDAREYNGEYVFSAPYVDATTNLIVQSVSAAIYNDSTLKGVVALDFGITEIDDSVSSEMILDNGYAFLMSASGVMASHNNLDLTAEPWNINTWPTYKDPTFKTAVGQMMKGCTGRIKYTNQTDSSTWYMAYTPVNVTLNGFSKCSDAVKNAKGYMVAVVVPENDVLKPFIEAESTIIRTTAIVFSVAGLIILGMTWFINKVISRMIDGIIDPIHQLLDIVTRLNKGDCDETMEDSIKEGNARSPEVIKLMNTFKKMTTVCKFSMQGINGGNLTKAKINFEKALELFESLGNQHGIGICQNNLGNVLLLMDKHKAAQDMLEKAVGSTKAELKEYHEGGQNDQELLQGLEKQFVSRQINLSHALESQGLFQDSLQTLMHAYETVHEVDGKRVKEYMRMMYIKVTNRLLDVLAVTLERIKDSSQVSSRIEATKRFFRKALDIVMEYECGPKDPPKSVMKQRLYYRAGVCQMQDHTEEGQRKALQLFMKCVTTRGDADRATISRALQNGLKIVTAQGDQKGVRWIKDQLQKFVVHQDKHVLFCLDYSGSMNLDNRIDTAVENIYAVYDNHITDKDLVSFVRFNRSVDSVFKTERKSPAVRAKIESNDPNYGTALYDALRECMDTLSTEANKNPAYVVALTDGNDNRSNKTTPTDVTSMYKANTRVTLIMIGLSLDDKTEKTVKKMTVDSKGVYLTAASTNDLKVAFAKVVEIMDSPNILMEEYN